MSKYTNVPFANNFCSFIGLCWSLLMFTPKKIKIKIKREKVCINIQLKSKIDFYELFFPPNGGIKVMTPKWIQEIKYSEYRNWWNTPKRICNQKHNHSMKHTVLFSFEHSKNQTKLARKQKQKIPKIVQFPFLLGKLFMCFNGYYFNFYLT